MLVPGAQDYLRISAHPDFPRFFVDSRGHSLLDVDGKWYTDFYLGSGAVILGHGHPGQVAHVRQSLEHGATVSLRNPIEVAFAERLRNLIPCADRFMFFKTGSECVHLAIRTALKATGRSTIVSYGYHGWLTPFDQQTIPSDRLELLEPSWDLEEGLACIRHAGENLAAVIVSPSAFATDADFYRLVGQAAKEVGAIFIMDEVKSGFRFKYPCLSVVFELEPDLLLLAKAISNGFPLAVMGGREALLGDRDLISVFSTFASENVSLFAADYCVQALAEGAYERFESASSTFYSLLKEKLGGTGASVVGAPTFFRLELPGEADLARVASRLAQRRLLFHPKDEVLLSAAHADDELLSDSAEIMSEVFHEMFPEQGREGS